MMMLKLTLAAVMVALCAHSTPTQTASDLAARYGKPVRAYAASEHIWMTPEYSTDGQVCRMRLYPRRLAADSNLLSRGLPFRELVEVLDRLMPADMRGEKKDSFGTTATGGGSAWTTYSYEKVTFTFIAPFRIDPAERSKPYNFAEQKLLLGGTTENATADQEHFSRSRESGAEIVIVEWSGRKCVSPK